MARFETNFPPNARQQEIGQVLDFVKKGKSVQFISVFGAGRSTVLRLLMFNPSIQSFHLKNDSKNYIFLYLNFAEISTSTDIYKLLFFYLNERTKENNQLSNPINLLYEKAMQTDNQVIFFQLLKQAFEIVGEQNITTVLLLDRFSEFPALVTEEFFANLRSLKNSAGKFSVIFSTHQPIEQISNVSLWKHFYEFVVGNQVYMNMKDSNTTLYRVGLLEKERGKKLSDELREMIVKITGGHGKLTKLSAELILEANSAFTEHELIQFLLKHKLIQASLYEILYGLTKKEQEDLRNGQTTESLSFLSLPFPLFSEFINQHIAEKINSSEIGFIIKNNQIYFEEKEIEELTNQEFKLLSFFIQNPNRVINRDETINAVWSNSKTTEGVSNEALDQMIFRLRKKIEDEQDNPKHLLTIKGRGFRFLL